MAAAAKRVPTFGEYAEAYLKARRVKGRPLEASTLRVYRSYLDLYILPTFGAVALDAVTPKVANAWYDSLPDKPKTRRGTYSLARSILTEATSAHGPIVGMVNPFVVRGAGSGSSPKREKLVTSDEATIILATIREEWRAMVLLALWCGLRFGELVELRRSDVDLDKRVIHVRRALGG